MEEIIMPSEQVDAVVNEINERTRRRAYRLKINEKIKPGFFDSRFGGIPYWNMSMKYPQDSKGNKLILLAQINLGAVKPLNNSDGIELPDCGILQFFIAPDDVYGADFDNSDVQNGFRVVYHRDIDMNVTEDQVMALGVKSASDEEYSAFSPVIDTVAVDIYIDEVILSAYDYKYQDMFINIAKEKFGYDFLNDLPFYDIVSEEDCEDIYEIDMDDNGKHCMLGYPFFTQEDPRGYKTELKRYDMLLFQMDTDMRNHHDYVVWGDCGIGNFFINSRDLKNQDFSRIMYNWDCC